MLPREKEILDKEHTTKTFVVVMDTPDEKMLCRTP